MLSPDTKRAGTPRTVGRKPLEAMVEDFRALVWRGIEKAAAHGHKFNSYEGAMSLGWPRFVDTRLGCVRYTLNLSCSIFPGPTNHYAWRGQSWAEVFRKATSDVERWISEIGAASTDQPRDGEDLRKLGYVCSGSKHTRIPHAR